MKVKLLLIGKTNKDYLQAGMDEYKKRFSRSIRFSEKVIPNLKNAGNLSVIERKNKEGEKILKNLALDDFVILLDEKGKNYSSIEFAKEIENKMSNLIKNLVFVIGGAYGFSDSVYRRANEKLSLSKMTFSHQIIRLIFLEQFYRAITIIGGGPYHNG